MSLDDKWIEDIANAMREEADKQATPKPLRISVRGLLQKYNYSRRGAVINTHIRNKLDELHLRSTPDFENAWFDERIEISLDNDGDKIVPPDPTHRIAILNAAHNKPVSVSRDDPISTATTLMMMHDYSQLPVMQGEHTVNGIISWKTIGARMSLNRPCEWVRDCIEPAKKVAQTAPLFAVIGTIAESGYVLVQESETNPKIIGIVTAADLSNQFAQLAGPFLLSGQIERHLRNLVHSKFSVPEIQQECSVSENIGQRNITGASDLTLGDYQHLLSKPEKWDKLKLNVDRVEFLKCLESVRRVRNNVMHFNPEGLSEEDLQTLHDAATFLDALMQMGAI